MADDTEFAATHVLVPKAAWEQMNRALILARGTIARDQEFFDRSDALSETTKSGLRANTIDILGRIDAAFTAAKGEAP